MFPNWGTIKAGGFEHGENRHDPSAVESQLKANAEAVLDKLGLTASDAIRLFYKQIAMRKGLPFDVAIPNAATQKAIRDVKGGTGLSRYKDADELFEKLGF